MSEIPEPTAPNLPTEAPPAAPLGSDPTIETPHTSLRPYLIGSAICHISCFLIIVLSQVAFGAPKKITTSTPIRASLVRLGTPRNEKLLPTKPSEEAPPTTPVFTGKKAPKVDPKKNTAKNSRALSDAFKKVERPNDGEGSPDGDPEGTSDHEEGVRYFGILQSGIQRRYDVSDAIPEQERRHLMAEVTLRLDFTGAVIATQLRKSSGNSTFDAAVLRAVAQAAPFPPPPPEIRDELQSIGIAFAFRAIK